MDFVKKLASSDVAKAIVKEGKERVRSSLKHVMEEAAKSTNTPVDAASNYSRAAPINSGEGEVHMLIFAIDYKRTANPLTCSMDGRNMEKLAHACGVQDLVAMYDDQCQKHAAFAAIQDIGSRCADNDYLIIYYSGHGTSLKDQDGDEADGYDEAYCFIDEHGQVTAQSCMRDDDFADAVINATSEGVRILVLSDCCHSGTIADLRKTSWGPREAISISGCLDNQTSGDMGRGGIFTHSMLLAIDHLQDSETEDYSVGMLYNGTLDYDERIFKSAQDITIQTSRNVTPDRMAWPLIPRAEYKAPLTQAASASGATTAEEAVQHAMINPQLLEQLGINPHIMQFFNASGLAEGKIEPKQLLQAGIECWKAGGFKDMGKRLSKLTQGGKQECPVQ